MIVCIYVYIVACLLKARIVKPLLSNGSTNTPVVRQWLSSRHVISATDTHVTIELLKVLCSVRSLSSLHNEDQLPFEMVEMEE
jgi:hypothetical protein